jgi:hypothetical protein
MMKWFNLTLRFLLELAGLFALGYWGWTQHEGLLRVLLALGLPLLAALLWGMFRVDNDPGKAPVRVPGWLRLLLETAYFGGSVLALAAAGQPTAALALGALVLFNYAAMYDRLFWLLRQ